MCRRSVGRLWNNSGGHPLGLQELKKTGLAKLSRSDPDSRFLKQDGHFTLG
jgi:hypothetical protein